MQAIVWNSSICRICNVEYGDHDLNIGMTLKSSEAKLMPEKQMNELQKA